MSVILTNIQRFSLHDGPGIRTTVFLKGCSLRCPWCSNPENLSNQPELYIKDGIQGTYGKRLDSKALIYECLKDKAFYEGKLSSPELWNITSVDQIKLLPGGITFSGGEALLQIEQLVSVIQTLHEENVHVAVETCLFVPPVNLCLALQYIDFFYVDVKILDPEFCNEVEKGNLTLYLSNLNMLLSWTDSNGNHKPVIIRIPVIGSYTDTSENRKLVHNLLQKSLKQGGNIIKIELIKEHNLGKSKYCSLGLSNDYHGVSDDLMETYKTELADLGIITEICKI